MVNARTVTTSPTTRISIGRIASVKYSVRAVTGSAPKNVRIRLDSAKARAGHEAFVRLLIRGIESFRDSGRLHGEAYRQNT
jgi:hypothetical protein